jgi:predicted nucleic acid-binding protein
MNAPVEPGRSFFDTNVVLYLFSHQAAKADRTEALMAGGGVISVQVLNETANVARRKMGMDWGEIGDVTRWLQMACVVETLTASTHDRAIALAGRLKVSFYDALIIASALMAGCSTLFTEDLHNGLVVERSLIVRDPFAG